MRSYRNKKDEVINVSQEHLDMAVRIKLELQKSSPSRACSWRLHKELMGKEGFFDSEASEAYRTMVKNYQKSIGELPPASAVADERTSAKLESIKELVGDMTWVKEENKVVLRQLNKAKRDIINSGLFIEEVKTAINNAFKNMEYPTISPIESKQGTKLVALTSDWHIGALVDVEDNKYNFEIAKQRIQEYTGKLLALAREKSAVEIEVVYMGDAVEGMFMRAGQGYHAEFAVAEQMTRCAELLIEMLVTVSREFPTKFRAFAGNHDRMNQQDKNGNIDGDSAIVIINKIVETFINVSKNPNLEFISTHHYNAKLEVNGIWIKAIHGDNEKKADQGKINDHSSRDGIIYSVICYGHFHHHAVLEVGINKFEVRVGSTKGSDDYSEKLGLGSSPSQAVLIIGEDGEIDVKRIGLR